MDLRDDMEEKHRDKIFLLPNGIDLKEFRDEIKKIDIFMKYNIQKRKKKFAL